MGKTKEQYIEQAKQDFKEFCKEYDGRQFSVLEKTYKNPYNYLDIDFKSITATVTNVFDRCVIYSQVIDIWDEEGQLIDSIFINIDEI